MPILLLQYRPVLSDNPGDQMAIHKAMEQQTIVITEAGIAPSSASSSAGSSSSSWDAGAEINSRTTHHCDDLSWVPADSRIFRVSVSVGVVKG